MVYTLSFFLQNAVCFIILTYLVPVLFTFYIQGVLKIKKNNSGAKRLNQIGLEYADCSWDLSWSPMKRRSECGNKPEPCVQQVERLLAWYSVIKWPSKYRIYTQLVWCPWCGWVTESQCVAWLQWSLVSGWRHSQGLNTDLVSMVTMELGFWVASQPGVEYRSGFHGYDGAWFLSSVTARGWIRIWFPWLWWSLVSEWRHSPGLNTDLVSMVMVELGFWVASQPGVEYRSGFHGYGGAWFLSGVTARGWIRIWFPWLRWSLVSE